MDDRVSKEFSLLQEAFPQAVREDRWVMLPEYPLPEGWSEQHIPVALFFKPPYPTASPYGIYVPPGLMFNGKPPNNYAAAGESVPFSGAWWVFSWQAEQWFPGASAEDGHNMRTFALGINRRFREGL